MRPKSPEAGAPSQKKACGAVGYNAIFHKFVEEKQSLNLNNAADMAVRYSKRSLGKVIREYRLAKNWSQEELGFESGVARNFVSLVELGRHSPTVDRFEAIAQALGFPGSILLAQAELLRDKKRPQKT